MSSGYVPAIVYENLRKFVQYRGINTPHTWMEKAKFVDTLKTYEYVLIEGSRVDSRGINQNVFVYLIMPESQYALKSPEFRKLFGTIPKSKLGTAEVMFISQAEHSPHLKRLVDEIRGSNPGIYLEVYDYTKFLCVFPEHNAVDHHAVVPKDIADNWLRTYGVNKHELAKIHSSDVGAVWIGAKPGDLIAITRGSESAGKSVKYRYCINR